MSSETVNFDPTVNEKHLPNTTQSIFIAAIFFATFASSLLPLRIVSNLRNVIDPDKRVKYIRAVSALNCFGGGVFLGTAFLDLLPTVTSLIEKALPSTNFPIGEFVITFGFLVILTAEQIAVDCKERASDCRSPIERLQTRSVQLERETLTTSSHQQEENVPDKNVPPVAQPEENPNKNSPAVLHSLFLLFALSIHSLFEGLAIGLVQSRDVVIQLFIAILLHKIPVAFSLGLNLVQSELKISAVIQLNLWFSLMSPVGAGIGIVLSNIDPSLEFGLLNGVLVGMTTGTFIFIIFFEILPKELKKGRGRLLNLLFAIIGYSFVCVAILIESRNS